MSGRTRERQIMDGRDALGEVRRVINNIELRNFAIPVTLRAEIDDFDPMAPLYFKLRATIIQIHVTIIVPDRDSGKTLPITFMQGTDWRELCRGDDYIEALIFNMVAKLLMHELEEAWHYKGERIRDPHAPTTGHRHNASTTQDASLDGILDLMRMMGPPPGWLMAQYAKAVLDPDMLNRSTSTGR